MAMGQDARFRLHFEQTFLALGKRGNFLRQNDDAIVIKCGLRNQGCGSNSFTQSNLR